MKEFKIAYRVHNSKYWRPFSCTAKNEKQAVRKLKKRIGLNVETWLYIEEEPGGNGPSFDEFIDNWLNFNMEA